MKKFLMGLMLVAALLFGCASTGELPYRDGYFISTQIEVVDPIPYTVKSGAITSDSLENMTKAASLLIDGYTYRELNGKYINILKEDVGAVLIGIAHPLAAALYSYEYIQPFDIGPYMQFETKDGKVFWVFPTEHVKKLMGT